MRIRATRLASEQALAELLQRDPGKMHWASPGWRCTGAFWPRPHAGAGEHRGSRPPRALRAPGGAGHGSPAGGRAAGHFPGPADVRAPGRTHPGGGPVHEGRRHPLPLDLAGRGRPHRPDHRPDPMPHDFVVVDLTDLRAAATAIKDMWVRARPLIGAEPRPNGVALHMAADPSRCRPRGGLRRAGGDPTDGDQPALGARRHEAAPSPPSARRSGAMSPMPARRQICDEDVEINRQIGLAGLKGDRDDRGEEAGGRAGQHPDPLQRGLAGARWTGAPPPRPIYQAVEMGHSGACLGRRDPAAQPGRPSDRVGEMAGQRGPATP